MTKRCGVLLVAIIGVVLVGSPRPAASDPVKGHSGTVVLVDPSARAVVVRELVEEGRPKTVALKVPAQAQIVLSERLPEAEITDLARPFRDTAIDLAQLKTGDFVVVESTPDTVGEVASRITVTLRGETP